MSLLVAPPSKIGDEEVLARYVVYRKYIRADLTAIRNLVKQMT